MQLTINAALLAGIATGIFFLTGSAYFTSFMIRLSAPTIFLDLPSEVYILFGFLVFVGQWQASLLLLGAAAAASWLARRLRPSLQIGHTALFAVAALALMVVAAVPLAYRRAEADVASLEARGFPYHPRAAVQVAGDGALQDRLRRGCFRLLLQMGGRVILFSEGRDDGHALVVLPLSAVGSIATRAGPAPADCAEAGD